MLRRTAMKPKPRKAATAVERRHLGRVGAMPCLVCERPAEVHHITSDGGGRITRTHKRCVPLCEACHRTGPNAVHKISHTGFCDLFGIDLLAEADNLWADAI